MEDYILPFVLGIASSIAAAAVFWLVQNAKFWHLKGHWLQEIDVPPGSNEHRFSELTISLGLDGPKIQGRDVCLADEPACNWESVACALVDNSHRLFYVYKVYKSPEDGCAHEGFGKITLERFLGRTSYTGYFSDVLENTPRFSYKLHKIGRGESALDLAKQLADTQQAVKAELVQPSQLSSSAAQ